MLAVFWTIVRTSKFSKSQNLRDSKSFQFGDDFRLEVGQISRKSENSWFEENVSLGNYFDFKLGHLRKFGIFQILRVISNLESENFPKTVNIQTGRMFFKVEVIQKLEDLCSIYPDFRRIHCILVQYALSE